MEKKVVYEVRLSKPLMAVAIVAAFGLLAIGVKPIVEATPAFASSNIQKIAICESDGSKCAKINRYALIVATKNVN